MTTKAHAIPTGYSTLTPYINIKGAAEAIEFYKKVFGAREVGRINMPDGTIAHAEIEIGNSETNGCHAGRLERAGLACHLFTGFPLH